MVYNISIFFSWICVFLSITDIQIVHLQTVPNPCPDITRNSTIVDMCTTHYATEEDINGGTIVDSVSLRVMIQQDGCTCEVTLLNQTRLYTIHMRKYDSNTRAAPEEQACGLAIVTDYNIPNGFPDNRDPVECTEGTQSRSISLTTNGILHLRSRVINGTFTRGYCMQIYRQHSKGDDVGIQINCFHPNMQTTKHTNDAAIQDTSISEPTPTTQQTTYAAIQDKTASDTDSALYIGIGVGSAVVVIALFVTVAIVIIRRKGNKDKNGAETQPEVDCTDNDSDGLKYNTLYNSSEHQDIMEGDYHTVELEGKQNRTGIQNLGSDYSVDDGKYSSIDIVNIHGIDGSKTDNRIKTKSATTPRSEIQSPEKEMSNTLKHVTEGSNVEYAVVDKSGRTDQNIKHISAPNDSTVEYAIIDKK
ncbi:uncharacterized protein LOC143049425 [Mytilus galloprovincialis]|uniref:uncharacterized protein LOC143049425 n=1 Tax=Mytilus galloprovincialis TaxID=29158 RepID=UPI003F7C37E1